MQTFCKDPQAVLDWTFDWAQKTNLTGPSDWLDVANGELITSETITVSSGLTEDSHTRINSDTAVIVWLSGGTAGQEYTVACRITTNQGRTDERTITIKVEER